MKFLIFFALVTVALAAPQSRKVFHENFEDFLDIIEEHAGSEINQIMIEYLQYEEFLGSVKYLSSLKFRGLIEEMESLPEFKAVLDYLESHSIDVTYFLGLLNQMLEYGGPQGVNRQSISGGDFQSFTNDVIKVFPKEELAALFDQKLAEDEDFKAAIEGVLSDEFQQLWAELWENEVFLAEVQALNDNGINVGTLIVELLAIFGQS